MVSGAILPNVGCVRINVPGSISPMFGEFLFFVFLRAYIYIYIRIIPCIPNKWNANSWVCLFLECFCLKSEFMPIGFGAKIQWKT